MPAAAIYVRVSSVGQADAVKVSPETQREECLARAETDGFEVDSGHIFEEAISGASPERPRFLAMLDAAKEKRFERVYVWAQDRLSRAGMRETLMVLFQLDETGVKVVSIQEGDLTDDLLVGIRAWMAGEERKRIGARTAPARRKKWNAGLWVNGVPPYGYRLDRETKRMSVCPVEGPIVRHIFDLAIRGLGRVEIAKLLNGDSQFPPPELRVRIDGDLAINGRQRTRRLRLGHILDFEGKTGLLEILEGRRAVPVGRSDGIYHSRWQASTVTKILSNTIAYGYRGSIQFQIDPSPILTKATFDDARNAIRSRRQASGPRAIARWLLTGSLNKGARITCGTCAATYVLHQSRSYNRYCCNGRRTGKGCKNPNIAIKDADDMVLAELRLFLKTTLSEDDMSDILRREAMTASSELEARIEAAKLERVDADDKRTSLLAEWRDGRNQGLPESALLEIGNELSAATDVRDEIDKNSASWNRQLVEMHAQLTVKSHEINLIADQTRRMLDVGMTEDSHVRDVGAILEECLEQIVMMPDGRLVVSFATDQGTTSRIFHRLKSESMAVQRNIRSSPLAPKL